MIYKKFVKISKSDSKLIRKMLKMLLFTGRNECSNTSGLVIVDIFLYSLYTNNKITLKAYSKYMDIFNNSCRNEFKTKI